MDSTSEVSATYHCLITKLYMQACSEFSPLIRRGENQGTQPPVTSPPRKKPGFPKSQHCATTPLFLKPRTAQSTKGMSK